METIVDCLTMILRQNESSARDLTREPTLPTSSTPTQRVERKCLMLVEWKRVNLGEELYV